LGRRGAFDLGAKRDRPSEATQWRRGGVLRVSIAPSDDNMEQASGNIASWAMPLPVIRSQRGIERGGRAPSDTFDDGARPIGVGEVAGVDFGVALEVDVEPVAVGEGVAVILAGGGE
jgi:hypothetical protein